MCKMFVSMGVESYKSYRGFVFISFNFYPHTKKNEKKDFNCVTETAVCYKKSKQFYI